YLFYSANWWESHEYAIGYAVCDSVTGPCVKPSKKPFFTYKGPVMGPGGQEFFTDTEGNLWMAYHAWTAPNVGYPGGSRSLRLERVFFEDAGPVINGPTQDPQPLP
ncbi:MAG TPA: family 43 glycosylhydrolase, partial [Thermoflexia bacterium]|nr:family 43 glycosylhydrolase [Thermoflexia bacterium]